MGLLAEHLILDQEFLNRLTGGVSPLTSRTSILAVGFVARCDSVVISARRGSSLPGRGVGRKVCSPALRPPLGLPAVSACREEITTGPNLISEAVPGLGGARD